MVAALWEPIFAGVLVFAALLAATGVAAVFLLWRFSRRKWRAFRSHGLVVGAAVALWEATASSRLGPQPSSFEDVNLWTPRRMRKELWRAVDSADAAVRAASQAGAPTASLPGLCRRLHDVSVGLDRVLRVETAGPVPPDVASQAVDVMRAATDVRQAALASASDASAEQVRNLVLDADHEIQCLDAGLASAQAALPRRDR